MSDSPLNRPRRSSALAAFYIDEDDFEDVSVSNKAKKSLKEEVFHLNEKLDLSDSDTTDVDETENEFKPIMKKQSKPAKKSITTGSSLSKPKPAKIKKTVKSSSGKAEKNGEDDFEILVEEENGQRHDENSCEENFSSPNHDTKSSKALKNISQKKITASLPQKSSITIQRPKVPHHIEKVNIPTNISGPRRVGLSRHVPTRPLSPVKLRKFD